MTPIRCSPNAMMTTPPTIRTHGFEMIAAPTSPAAAPSKMKMTESPALKASELKMTARRAPAREPFSPFRCSALTPDIREM